MKDKFSDLLDQCLAEIAAGRATPGSCAAACPEYADQLLPLLEASEQVRAIPVPLLRPEKHQAIQAQLLARPTQLKQDSPSSASVHALHRRLASRLLPLMVIALLVCSLLSAGVMSVSAAALPGDALYPIKRLTEEAWVTFTPPSDQTKLHIYLAGRRLAEFQTLADRGDVRQELFDEVTVETSEALNHLTALSAADQQTSLELVLSTTDRQTQVLSAVAAQAPEAARPGLLRALNAIAANHQRALGILKTEPGLSTSTPETGLTTSGTPETGPGNSNKSANPSGKGTPGPKVTPPGQMKPKNTPPGHTNPKGIPPGQLKD